MALSGTLNAPWWCGRQSSIYTLLLSWAECMSSVSPSWWKCVQCWAVPEQLGLRGGGMGTTLWCHWGPIYAGSKSSVFHLDKVPSSQDLLNVLIYGLAFAAFYWVNSQIRGMALGSSSMIQWGGILVASSLLKIFLKSCIPWGSWPPLCLSWLLGIVSKGRSSLLAAEERM